MHSVRRSSCIILVLILVNYFVTVDVTILASVITIICVAQSRG